MSLSSYIKKLLGSAPDDLSMPDEYCPNCWGEQEYDGKVREILAREHIDLNNVEENLGWIEAYVIEHFEGIKIKEENGRKVCPSCQRQN